MKSTDSYHLDELRVAMDPHHPAHTLPPSAPAGARVLDVGCGAGQTLLATYPDRLTFGMDIDTGALALGQTLTTSVAFVCAKAEALPFATGQLDLVVARVSLPYTVIGQSLGEIRRVLRPGGSTWMSLHPLSLYRDQVRRANWNGRLFFAYVVANGLCFHAFQRQFALAGRQECFQTESGMRRALTSAGFREIRIDRSKGFVITATA